MMGLPTLVDVNILSKARLQKDNFLHDAPDEFWELVRKNSSASQLVKEYGRLFLTKDEATRRKDTTTMETFSIQLLKGSQPHHGPGSQRGHRFIVFGVLRPSLCPPSNGYNGNSQFSREKLLFTIYERLRDQVVEGSDSHPFTKPIRTYILNKLASLLILTGSNGRTYDATMEILQTDNDATNKLALDLVKAAGTEAADSIHIEQLKKDFVQTTLLKDLREDNKIRTLVIWILDTISIMGMRKLCPPYGMLAENETEQSQLTCAVLKENKITLHEAFGKFYRIIQERSRTQGKNRYVLADHKVQEAAGELSSLLVYQHPDVLMDIKQKLTEAYCQIRPVQAGG